MMNKLAYMTALSVACLVATPHSGSSQTVGQGAESAEAVLNTSVMFAIGAREAQQQIRGSFGWPTFQEGFVDGVYFRFDPDGYARFSTSPRLDEDVFEVICATGSVVCAAKKGPIEVGLTVEGKVQLRIAGITPDDSFHVLDRKTELPLPPSVLDPLDARLETLLSSGGDLVVRRAQETIQTISLSGFYAVTTYLRWVAQQQSARVFPRGWPVPAQTNGQPSNGLTQPDQWVPPNSAPQQVATTFQSLVGGGQVNPQLNPTSTSGRQTNFGVIQNNRGAVASTPLDSNPQSAQINDLQQMILNVQSQLQVLNGSNQQRLGSPTSPVQTVESQNTPAVDISAQFAEQARARSLPVPTGFGNQTSSLQRPTNDFVQPSEQTVMARPSDDHSAMRHKIYDDSPAVVALKNLEQQIFQLRQEMTTLFSQLHAALLATNHLAGLSDQSVSANQTMDPTTPAISQQGSTASFGKGVTPSSVSSRGTSPESANSLERELVEDLLKELDEADANAQEIQIENSQVESPTDASVISEETTEDFISLSDYISKVLKSEGVTAGGTK